MSVLPGLSDLFLRMGNYPQQKQSETKYTTHNKVFQLGQTGQTGQTLKRRAGSEAALCYNGIDECQK